MTTPSINYVTVIAPVLEVTLVGTVNHRVWQEQFQDENLQFMAVDGKSEIIISAVDSKYYGIPFREFSVSTKVSDGHYFLAHAYNSLAPFAFAERAFFRTPYYHGKLAIQPRHITLSHGAAVIFEASLPEQTDFITKRDEYDELLVHLPKHLRKQATQPHYFYARLEGYTETYAASSAALKITPSSADSILNLLKISDFQAEYWRIRATAQHSKSKTYFQTTTQ